MIGGMRKNALGAHCLAVAVLLFFAATETWGATLVVRNTNNNLAGSLRQAIQDAAPGDTIVFQIPTTDPRYEPFGAAFVINLTSGELGINKDLTINGAGTKIVVRHEVAGPARFRVFNVTGGNVTIANLTVSEGRGELSTPAGGSGIYNTANLTVRNCTFFANGVGSELGGAIHNQGTLEVTNCTFIDNNALQGAGIYNTGTLLVRNSTIALNRAGDAGTSGGIHQAGGNVRVRSTIIAQNSGRADGQGRDVFGSFISEGFNFIGNGEGSIGFGGSESRDQVGNSLAPAQPLLQSADFRGGSTATMGLRADSPAIDQGSSGGVTTDQRGLPRPIDQPGIPNASGGDGSDIGAVEVGLGQSGPTYTVTTTGARRDGGAVSCTTDDCTLREALELANANSDANTINFSPDLSGILPVQAEPFTINHPLTINGPGARQLALSGFGERRVLVVSDGVRVVISGLTFRDATPPAGTVPRFAAAIYNTGDLTLNDCTITDNVALSGAAIYNDRLGRVTLFGCTVSNNRATDRGEGGAIFDRGVAFSAINSTFSGNRAYRAGAIQSSFDLTLVNCTVSGNTAEDFVGGVEANRAVIANSIIAGNTATTAFDVAGNFTSEGNNFIGRSDHSTGLTDGVNGDQVGTNAAPRDPLLGPLQNNGGPTDTHALLAGSTAINAANNSSAPRFDQRGFSRIGLPDIGAFEFGGLPTGLVNISTRLRVGTGDNALIGGFIVTGTQPKRLMARAIGPSTGVAGALADPQLEIFNAAGERVGFNNNWREAPNRDEMIATTIAPTNELESAVLGSVNPGAYTAVVRGVGGGSGVGLVEVFDLNRAADSKLANISTRGVVQTGEDVMIGGFIVEGARNQRILIRALGPSLPLAGTLSDPVLEIYNREGTLLVANDNWRSAQEEEIAATGIPPANNLEAAIVGPAPAGAYTAIVRGAGGGTGVALVEVYALDF